MNPQIFMWIVGILIGAIVALIGFIVNYILRSQITAKKELNASIVALKADFDEYKKTITESVSVIKKEQDEIKFNYLKRFESVNHNINHTKEEIVNKIHDLHTLMIKQSNKQTDDNG